VEVVDDRLIAANDEYKLSFAEIADLIEQHQDELFVEDVA
jgi:hypothetical protein